MCAENYIKYVTIAPVIYQSGRGYFSKHSWFVILLLLTLNTFSNITIILHVLK
jgi:hypothetical protein